MTPSFMAAVQYDDWVGSAAADNLNHRDMRDLLVNRGLMLDNEFIVGITFYLAENHPGKLAKPLVRAVLLPKHTSFDEAKHEIDSVEGPLATRIVNIELSNDEFLGLFKRLSIVLTRRGLALEGRKYTTDDPQ